ncbi:hypothetical protein P153DRAFT_369794 [Dothidotthia symphoricarpi CBS 119687]|uniref:Carboxymuconolactone decarboxylase-like domain-containing protein n=1 Tax=Dothidotthia symphoricarpi CBS 119687 TaxID=1392245 RepID=A0A6A6A4G1_9PLEO|nr:uncharacterized protein P153DRAFT_369794 [Dothidotthia symphoricarpi CBS 119687]KAF2125797.1 hypothetical protein P153DRAFT_369794 [Dothidotthia symphoricarpi CBS 119687]
MATNEIPIPHDPTEEEASALFKAVEDKFPSKTLGDDKWYILVLAAMVGGGQPNYAPLLYKELISRSGCQTPEQRQALMRRIRETLFKLIIIVGVCKPLEAIMSIEEITRKEDKDYSFSREGWQCDDANLQRGAAWLDRIYKHNMQNINDSLAAQRDFDWTTKNITYGLYLSDQSILNDVETEITVLSGIMIQNLPKETAWHLRGTRRIGVSVEDVEALQECIELVARFCGLRLHRVPKVADIESEV